MPIPGDYPGMTNSQLDSYISDFLTAIYGEEVRDKFARIAYLIGHQIPDSVEPSVQAAAASAAEAAEEAENAANQAEAAEDAKTAASQSAQQAANAASESQESASSAASAAAAAEAAQEAAENAAQTATDAAGGDFLPKSGGKMSGDIILGENDDGTDTVELRGPQSQNPARVYFSAKTATYPTVTVAGGGGGKVTVGEGGGVSLDGASVSLQREGGNLTANGNRIQSVATPIAETDAANKAFVEESTQNVESAKKLSSAPTIDGVAFDGSSNIIHYGTCSTAAATAAKVVQCDGFQLVTGARIAVKFSHSNTAASPTLNVNGTGAKRLCKYGTSYVGNDWHDDEVVEFVYDGTQYQMVGTKLTVSYQDVEFKPYESTRSENYFNVHAEKYGRVVTLCVSSIIQFPSASFSGTLDTVTISADFRPTINQYVHGMGISGSSQVGNFRARINTDGTVTMVVPDARLAERHFTITYMAESGLS